MSRFTKLYSWLALVGLLLLSLGLSGAVKAAPSADANSRFFPQTGHTITQPFLDYWNTHGALAQQGLPITDDYQEVNAADGKTYRTQYFERARFEFHPEQTNPQYQVLLGLLGRESVAITDPFGDDNNAPLQVVPGAGSQTFPQTSQTVTGLFLDYWNTHGGLAQQGYPITQAFYEKNQADGKQYITQYFERARFEYHPEQADPQYKVLLGLLGTEIYQHKQNSGGAPTATPAPSGGVPSLVTRLTLVNGAILTNFPRTAIFTWDKLIGDTGFYQYHIEIQIYTGGNSWQEFQTATLSGTSKGPFGEACCVFTMNSFPGDNAGRWHVWATNNFGDGAKGDWWSFSFHTAAAPTSTPTTAPAPPTNTPTNTPVLPHATTSQVINLQSIPAGTNGSVVSNCPAGSLVVGGGWSQESNHLTMQVYNSSMSSFGWLVSAHNYGSSPQLLFSYAICLSGVNASVTQKLAQQQVPAGGSVQQVVSCSSGVITGGGFADALVMSLYNTAPNGNGWSAAATNNASYSQLLISYALCLNGVNATSQFIVQQTSVAAGALGGVTASCPSGSVVTGGGFAGNNGLIAYHSGMTDDGRGWYVGAKNLTANSMLLNAYAMCTTFH